MLVERAKAARTQLAPLNINVCACQCVYVQGDVNLDVLKKKKMLIHLGLLIVYGTVPALCCVLSASHSSDFIYFFRAYRGC